MIDYRKSWENHGKIMDREMEHLLTLSVCYQIAIGFIPLPFITPMDPVSTFT